MSSKQCKKLNGCIQENILSSPNSSETNQNPPPAKKIEKWGRRWEGAQRKDDNVAQGLLDIRPKSGGIEKNDLEENENVSPSCGWKCTYHFHYK